MNPRIDPERRIGARAEQKRRWDRENTGNCEVCGRTLGRRKSVRCPDHRADVMAAARKRAVIVAMWKRGHSSAEIADELGTTPASVKVMMNRMRKRGADLPYRTTANVR